MLRKNQCSSEIDLFYLCYVCTLMFQPTLHLYCCCNYSVVSPSLLIIVVSLKIRTQKVTKDSELFII